MSLPTLGSGKNKYLCTYKGKKVEVLADTQLEARDLAAKHFQARKPYEVEAYLVELAGKPYAQTTMFASQQRNAGIKKDILGELYYDVKVVDFELQVVPLTYSDDDWEYTGDGGVRIQMGKDGRGGYTLLNKSQFALLMKELKNAEALVHEVHSASSDELRDLRMRHMASDRSSLIRLASKMPVGSGERRAILAGLITAGDHAPYRPTDEINVPGHHIRDNARVSGKARVMEDAQVYDNAKVYGTAVVSFEAKVKGNAKVYGNAGVGGKARVYDHAEVYDNADLWGEFVMVYGRAKVYGNAKVYDWAEVYDNAQVFGNAKVDGKSDVYGNARVFGDAQVLRETYVGGNARIGGDAVLLGGVWDGSEGEILSGRWKAPGVPV